MDEVLAYTGSDFEQVGRARSDICSPRPVLETLGNQAAQQQQRLERGRAVDRPLQLVQAGYPGWFPRAG
jgi:hypothetical protein